MSFELEDAIRIANQALISQGDRHLTDLEVAVLQGVWERLDYDQIAARTAYATSYISQDVAPGLWRLLSEALGEKVRKSNCRSALQRHAGEFQDCLLGDEHRSLQNTIVVKHRNGLLQPSSSVPSSLRRDSSLSTESQPPSHYVQRPPLEKICYDALLQPGALVRLKAPRLMGKTSFITTVLADVAQIPYRVARVSFEMADRAVHFHDLNRFLRWLCYSISHELQLPSALQECWEEAEIGAKVSCTSYMEEYLLAQEHRPLVLCLDDVDVLFSYPDICEDFFGLLRSWHEKARIRPLWMQLRLVIVHSTEVCVRLHWSQSPFNVGLPLELPELTLTQIRQLAEGYQVSITPGELGSLVQLIGGHPALLDQTFHHLQTHANASVKQLLDEAITESGLFGHHLREHLLILQDNGELTAAFEQVIKTEAPVVLAPLSAYRLQRMGLIRLAGNQATARCQLYRQYFRDRLPLLHS